jgi:hypothetical protein
MTVSRVEINLGPRARANRDITYLLHSIDDIGLRGESTFINGSGGEIKTDFDYAFECIDASKAGRLADKINKKSGYSAKVVKVPYPFANLGL